MPSVAWTVRAAPPLFHPVRWVVVGIFAAATVLGLLWGRATRWRQATLAVAVCGQSAVFFGFWLLAGSHGRAVDAGAVRFLQAHSATARVVSFGPLVPNYGAMFGVAEVGFNELPAPATWVQAAAARLQPGFDGIDLYEGALPSADRLRVAIPAYEAMGAAYALTWPGEDLGARFAGAALAYRGAAMDVWALPAPAAYAHAAGCTVHAQGRLVLQLTCAMPSSLLRRELFVPGWRASVNGEETPVHQADIFQAVDVPAGESVVRFAYTPPGIGWAWAGCAAGVLLLFGGTMAAPRLWRIEPVDDVAT
jgi:hypothetical protein